MEEENKNEYLSERIGESRSRVLISIIAAVLILACALFTVYVLYTQREPEDISAPSSSPSQAPVSDVSLSASADESSAPVSDTESTVSDDESGIEVSAPEVSDEVSYVEETVYGKTINGVYVYGNTAVSLLSGSASNQSKFAAAVTAIGEKFGESVKVYDCIVPTYVEFYRNADGKKVSSADQKAIIQSIYDEIAGGVTVVDAYSALASHTDEYLYFRTDPNWTQLGAYYTYSAIATAMGLTPVGTGEYEVGVVSEYLGENFNSTRLSQLAAEPDYINFYKVDAKFPSDVTHYYSDGTSRSETQMVYKSVSNPLTYGYMIFGSRGPFTEVKTNLSTGKKILILADDTRSALSPFFLAHCDELYVGEIKTFQEFTEKTLSAFVENKGITDIVIVTYTGNARNQYRIANLNDMLG